MWMCWVFVCRACVDKYTRTKSSINIYNNCEDEETKRKRNIKQEFHLKFQDEMKWEIFFQLYIYLRVFRRRIEKRVRFVHVLDEVSGSQMRVKETMEFNDLSCDTQFHAIAAHEANERPCIMYTKLIWMDLPLYFAFLLFISFISVLSLFFRLLLIHSHSLLVFFLLLRFRPLTRLQQVAKNSDLAGVGPNAIYTQHTRKSLEMGRKWSGLFVSVTFFLSNASQENSQNYYTFFIWFAETANTLFSSIFAYIFAFWWTIVLGRCGANMYTNASRRNGLNRFAYFSNRWNTHSILFNLMHA